MVLVQMKHIFKKVFDAVEKKPALIVEDDLSGPVGVLVNEHPAHRAFLLLVRFQLHGLGRRRQQHAEHNHRSRYQQ